MTVAGPGGPGAAQVVFGNQGNHDQLLEMHLAGVPFLEMAQRMKVEISPEYAKLIQGLSDDDVKKIRSAMIEALQAGRTMMPYTCDLHDQIPPGLRVTTEATDQGLWANVLPATAS